MDENCLAEPHARRQEEGGFSDASCHCGPASDSCPGRDQGRGVFNTEPPSGGNRCGCGPRSLGGIGLRLIPAHLGRDCKRAGQKCMAGYLIRFLGVMPDVREFACVGYDGRAPQA